MYVLVIPSVVKRSRGTEVTFCEGGSVLALLLAAALASPLPSNPPICAQYFPTTCSQAVGEWLPQFAYPSDFWDGATHVTQRDSFGETTSNGTLVVFTIEMQRAHVIYDTARHIVFFVTGCCSWGEVVLAYTTWPPRNKLSKTHSECGQFQNFYFRNDRLVQIQLGNGC